MSILWLFTKKGRARLDWRKKYLDFKEHSRLELMAQIDEIKSANISLQEKEIKIANAIDLHAHDEIAWHVKNPVPEGVGE